MPLASETRFLHGMSLPSGALMCSRAFFGVTTVGVQVDSDATWVASGHQAAARSAIATVLEIPDKAVSSTLA
jgi:hypothetical protein